MIHTFIEESCECYHWKTQPAYNMESKWFFLNLISRASYWDLNFCDYSAWFALFLPTFSGRFAWNLVILLKYVKIVNKIDVDLDLKDLKSIVDYFHLLFWTLPLFLLIWSTCVLVSAKKDRFFFILNWNLVSLRFYA